MRKHCTLYFELTCAHDKLFGYYRSKIISGWLYQLALTDCETIFEENLFMSEGE